MAMIPGVARPARHQCLYDKAMPIAADPYLPHLKRRYPADRPRPRAHYLRGHDPTALDWILRAYCSRI